MKRLISLMILILLFVFSGSHGEIGTEAELAEEVNVPQVEVVTEEVNDLQVEVVAEEDLVSAEAVGEKENDVEEKDVIEEELSRIVKEGSKEEREWVRRGGDRKKLAKVVARQFESELDMIRKVAEAEGATKTVELIDRLVGVREERYKDISLEIKKKEKEAEEKKNEKRKRRSSQERKRKRPDKEPERIRKRTPKKEKEVIP